MKITRREREIRIGSGGGRGGGRRRRRSYGGLLRRRFVVAIANSGRVSTARVNHGRRCHMYNFEREREKVNPILISRHKCRAVILFSTKSQRCPYHDSLCI